MGSVPSDIQHRNAKCTAWMTADELVSFLEEGDLVEFDREFYQHWGVYVQRSTENGIYYIVHLSGDPSDQLKGSLSAKTGCLSNADNLGASLQTGTTLAMVQSSDLRSVTNGRRCRINNYRDHEFTPFQKECIVARALSEIGKRKYNALFTNCEHFATWCRYGTKNSRQSSTVKSLATGILVGITTGSGIHAALAAGTYYAASRLGHRMWNRLNRERIGW